MSTLFERWPLTAAVAAALRTVQVGDPLNPGGFNDALVGEGTMPLGSGWNLDDPNAPNGFFVPYFVLTIVSAVPAADGGSLRHPQEDWHCPYVIQSFGIRQDQAEWMADKGRIALAPLKDEILQCGASKYRVQQAWTSQIGGVNRVPQSEPPFYVQQDSATLWMAKRRTP